MCMRKSCVDAEATDYTSIQYMLMHTCTLAPFNTNFCNKRCYLKLRLDNKLVCQIAVNAQTF